MKERFKVMEDSRTEPSLYQNPRISIRRASRNSISSERTTILGSIRKRYISFRAAAILLLLLAAVPNTAHCAETRYVIKGRVVDASTDKGLPFANILIENANIRTSTNEEGDFTLTLPVRETRMRVSYVGYKAQSVNVRGDGSALIVKLTQANYQMQEVNVVAAKHSAAMINSIQLGNAEIKDFAGVTRDPLRSLQLMPGVSTDNEASAKMDVRGGTWDENSILIDGAEIHNPYHLKEISLASIGIFNLDMVKNIDFSAGGWGAKYGDALSSITIIDYKEGSTDRFDGNLNVSLFDLSGSFQGPISKNSSFIVAVRRSYLGDLLQLAHMSPGIYAGYYDVQGDVDYRFDSLNKLKVDFIYSNDVATQSPSNISGMYAYSGSLLGQNTLVSRHTNLMRSFWGRYSSFLFSVNSRNVLTDRFISRTLLYYSGDIEHERPIQITSIDMTYKGFPDLWLNQTSKANASYDLDMRTLSISQELDYKSTPFLDLQAGVGLKRIFYNYFPDLYSSVTSKTNTTHFPDTTVSVSYGSLATHDTMALIGPSYAMDSYFQQTFQIGSNLIVNLGARFDYYDLDKQGEYSPRANVSYEMPFRIRMDAAWGIYYQLPNFDQIRMSEPSKDNTHFQKANHYILGFEKHFLDAASFKIQFYQKYYSDLIPTIRLAYGSLFYGTKQNDAVGFAKGMDLQFSLNLKAVDFFLSYSYLVAKEKTPGTEYYPRCSDQRNTASIAVVLNPGSGWTLDVRGYYGSGYAYTPSIGELDPTTMMTTWTRGNTNSSHYPAYERVDVRISKKFFVLHSPLQVYLDVTNVLNRRNVWSYNYTYDTQGNPRIEPMLLLGIVPTIGTSYSFQLN